MASIHVRARCSFCHRVFSLQVEVHHTIFVGDFLTGIECPLEGEPRTFEVLDAPQRADREAMRR